MDEVGESDYPTYGKLEEIIIWDDEKFFVVVLCETVEFNAHFMSYKIVTNEQKVVVCPQSLSWHGVF